MVCFVFRGDSQVCSEVNGLERFDTISFEEPFTGNHFLPFYFSLSQIIDFIGEGTV